VTLSVSVCNWVQVASAKVEAAIKLLLLNGCRSVVLAGHSMGAAICCETARR
jgi:surfactin synthase thioesterase subunit